MAVIPKPQFPNVPIAAGIPAVARNLNATAASGIAIATVSAIANFMLPVKWGIFLKSTDKKSFTEIDSVISIEYRNASQSSNYPQENGAFVSYNKVATPYNIRIRVTRGGSENQRTKFISDMEAAKKSTNLYTIVLPEVRYANANIEEFSYRREQSNGANLVIAELDIIEVRELPSANGDNPKQPEAKKRFSIGEQMDNAMDSVAVTVAGAFA
jgi:hypothetical protein